MHKWEDALRVAENKNHPEMELLRRNYFQWLTDTQQEEQAGEVNVSMYNTLLNLLTGWFMDSRFFEVS